MDAKPLIRDAIALLHEMDVDPRHPTMRQLEESLVHVSPTIPNNSTLKLTAIIEQGGAYTVTDQHGRHIEGVHSVAVFKDQSGRDVMQINL